MIVFNKNSICSTNYKGIEDFWTSYKHVELFVWKNISKVGFDAKLKTMIAENHMQLSVVLTDNEYLIVYFLFKNDILIPLKIKKSDCACQKYLQNGNVVPIATKIYGYPKPFFKYR